MVVTNFPNMNSKPVTCPKCKGSLTATYTETHECEINQFHEGKPIISSDVCLSHKLLRISCPTCKGYWRDYPAFQRTCDYYRVNPTKVRNGKV